MLLPCIAIFLQIFQGLSATAAAVETPRYCWSCQAGATESALTKSCQQSYGLPGSHALSTRGRMTYIFCSLKMVAFLIRFLAIWAPFPICKYFAYVSLAL